MSALSYPVDVQSPEIDDVQRLAPDDVRATIEWLSANGYTLRSHRGESTFGAQFIYAGQAEIHITVDRSQWTLDIAPRPGAQAWQYDLLIAAQTGQPYGEVFPETRSRSLKDPLSYQLPAGVSWRETLPGILHWMDDEDVTAAVEHALHERQTMWLRTRKR